MRDVAQSTLQALPTVGCTFGVWDLLHVGHVEFLTAAKEIVGKNGHLLVGVPGDAIVLQDKGRLPIITLLDRVKMLQALKCVDEVFPYFKLEFVIYLEWLQPNVLMIGEQWGNEQRHKDALCWCSKNNCRVVQLPYQARESSTAIKTRVIEQNRETQ